MQQTTKENVYNHETRLIRLEETNDSIKQTLTRLENNMIRLEDKMDEGFKTLNSRSWSNFYWMIAGFASLLTIIAHGFKWIP
jgi:predicted nuclease with TOPRIM domain